MKTFKTNKTLAGFENAQLTTDQMLMLTGGKKRVVIITVNKDGSITITVKN